MSKDKRLLKLNLQNHAQTGVNAAETGLNGDASQVESKAKDIDFVNVFGGNINKFLEVLGVYRKLPLQSGTAIKTYKSSVTLDNTEVEPGEIIPLSETKMEPAETYEVVWSKKRKATPVETIQRFGYDEAVNITDTLLIRELQKEVRQKLIDNLATGTKTDTADGLQEALAKGWGHVNTIFEDDGVDTIAFINTLDASEYLAEKDITIQSEFGLNYIENFLGVSIAIITSLVPKGTVYLTASDNLVLAYPIINGGEIGRGFDFYTDESGLIGVTHDINKQRLTAETITLSGAVLFAERLDGIVKVEIGTPGV